MSDDALRNAENRANTLREEIEALQTEIKAATVKMTKARDDLNKAMNFIHAWHDFAAVSDREPEDKGETPIAFEHSDEGVMTPLYASDADRPGNPKKEDVAEYARAAIDHSRVPLSRHELYEILKSWGISLSGKNPEMVLSTMLWRMQHRVVRLQGFGYWLAEVPYPPAQYTPPPEIAQQGL